MVGGYYRSKSSSSLRLRPRSIVWSWAGSFCAMQRFTGSAKGRWLKKGVLVTRAVPRKSDADPLEVMPNPVMSRFDGFPYRCCEESSGMLRLERVPSSPSWHSHSQ